MLLAVALVLFGGCTGSDDPPRPKSDAAPDARGGRKDAAPPDDAPAGDAPEGEPRPPGPDGSMAMCLGPVPNCTPSAGGACDPVCQARCGCQQRCVLASGMPLCGPQPPNAVPIGGSCSADFDDCTAGAVCLGEATDACGSHCYRFCRTSDDCPGGALCSFDVEVGGKTVAKACGSPPEKCDPTGPAKCLNAARPSPTFGCYVLSAQDPDSATCDCAGTKSLGSACMYEHECAPGLECIRVAGGAGSCRRVCHLGAGGCPTGACTPLGTTATPSTVYGYCP